MSGDDLAMVNFHLRASGDWTWTAYRKPMEMWRSNSGCADVFECLEQLVGCMWEETALEDQRREERVVEHAEAFGGDCGASGGIRSESAGAKRKPKRKRQTSKTRTL
jgi:hypothetical protein